MLRFGILGSTVPLLVLGLFARGEVAAPSRPCLVAADRKLQITALARQAQIRVGFTDDPVRATVRVQIVDDPDAADFAIADDAADTDEAACALDPATVLVAISPRPQAAEPAIYLTRSDDADYRVYVNSNSFTAREAAALVVAAGGKGTPLTTASIGGRL